jgi:hypothetical protein
VSALLLRNRVLVVLILVVAVAALVDVVLWMQMFPPQVLPTRDCPVPGVMSMPPWCPP